MNYSELMDELYWMPIKATSIHKGKKSKDVNFEIMVSQSQDYHFSISEGIDEGIGYVVSIDIPPERLEILKQHVDKAVENWKNKVKKSDKNEKNEGRKRKD